MAASPGVLPQHHRVSGKLRCKLVAMGNPRKVDQKVENGILVSETFTGYLRIPITLKVLAKSSLDDREMLRIS